MTEPSTKQDERMVLVWSEWAKEDGNPDAAQLFTRVAGRLSVLDRFERSDYASYFISKIRQLEEENEALREAAQTLCDGADPWVEDDSLVKSRHIGALKTLLYGATHG